MPEYEVTQLAEALGVIYLPTSAKTDYNVQLLFRSVADRVLQNRKIVQNGGINTPVNLNDSAGGCSSAPENLPSNAINNDNIMYTTPK